MLNEKIQSILYHIGNLHLTSHEYLDLAQIMLTHAHTKKLFEEAEAPIKELIADVEKKYFTNKEKKADFRLGEKLEFES